jgi:RimJ/RimL family protein N-acetyltransferase
MLSDLYESMNGAMPGLGQRDAGIHQPSTQQPNDADHLSQFFWQRPLEWWHHLPELASGDVRLRELRLSDAPSLAKTLGSAKVGEHLSSGPKTVAEAEQFIAWTRRARRAGRYICFGVTTQGVDEVVGLFQLWPLEPSFCTAEWGFALGHRHWGTGLFVTAARRVTAYAFDTIGVQRLEARSAVDNVRGNAALEKLGAVSEGILRKCFLARGEYRDHVMWSMLADDWRAAHNNDGLAREVTGDVT